MAALPTTDQIWRPIVRSARTPSMSQTGKRQIVVLMRERGGSTLPSVFRSESAVLGWISGPPIPRTAPPAGSAHPVRPRWTRWRPGYGIPPLAPVARSRSVLTAGGDGPCHQLNGQRLTNRVAGATQWVVVCQSRYRKLHSGAPIRWARLPLAALCHSLHISIERHIGRHNG
jgi:hypothetical protein